MQFLSSSCNRQADRPILGYCLSILLIAVGENTHADDGWPFVRGPAYNGHSLETNLADEWPAEGPPILWTRKLGQGYSAFVATRDRVFTQGQNVTGQYVYCLRADTGETVWEYRYDWPYEAAGVYPGPRSTPTLSHGRLFFTSPDGLLCCLDQSSGDRIWSKDLLGTYGIEGCDFGYACSPTVTDNMVILPVGGLNAGVVAFDMETGVEVWTSTSEPASYTPAFPIDVNGKALVVCYMQNSLLILRRHNGQLVHQIDLSHGYDEHSAWPIYNEPNLWMSGPFRSGSHLVDLSATESKTVWRSKTMSNDVCSSVLVDGHLYGFDIFDVQSKTHRPSRGIFRCVDFGTGEEKWGNGTGRPRRTSNADEFVSDIGQAGIIAADGKLIILNELGELILLKTDPNQCVELARCTVLGGELTWTPPCLSNGRIYVRNQSTAVCVYVGQPADLHTVVTLRAGDLSQKQYRNLAAIVLAVEPEYAFDVPHDRWLIQWFAAGIAMITIGKLSAAYAGKTLRANSYSPSIELVFLCVSGALGTTILGHLTHEFVFTWPVCLYAALEFVALPKAAEKTEEKSVIRFLRRRLPLFIFLCICMAYFLACRRLSLVFEWAFLAGFAGAVPVVWLLRWLRTRERRLPVAEGFVSCVGFAAFFATAVGFLRFRY
ncbi:MAG: PQQ-binding-like beta-propeller repeat protein [Fuerstiella sp.]